MNYIDEIMELGYTKKGAELILKKLDYYKYKPSTFLIEYENFKNKVTKRGYDAKFVNNILAIDPRLVSYSSVFDERFDNFKKYLSGEYTDYNVILSALIYKPETLNSKIHSLKKYGFTDDNLKIIFRKDRKFITRSEDALNEVYIFLLKIGLSRKNIINLFVRNSLEIFKNNRLLEENYKNIKKYGFSNKEISTICNNITEFLTNKNTDIDGLFELFRGFGIKDKEIRKIVVKYNKLVKFNKEGYNNIVDSLKSKGFTEEEIKKITLDAKEIVIYEKNKVSSLYDLLYEYKFTDSDIKKIFMGNPKILYHELNKLKETLNKLMEYDIKDKNLVNIIVTYPRIFETSIPTLDEKLKVITRNGLMDAINYNPKNLIQSAEKTFLRYTYMINEIELEPETEMEMCALFRKKPVFSKKVDGENTKVYIPDIDEIRKKGYVYYKDDESLDEKFKGRKCFH